jgi:hypothetical protein
MVEPRRRHPIVPEESPPASPPKQFPPPKPQPPEVGHSVVYRLSTFDLSNVAAVHGNRIQHYEGDVVAAKISGVDSATGRVNLHLFLDGPGTHWVENVPEGAEPGTWARA